MFGRIAAAFSTFLFLLSFAAAQTSVTGSLVQSAQGGPLPFGHWCFGSTCVTVTNGYFDWNTFVVASGVTFTGNGVPYLACQNGAVYTQNDAGGVTWNCVNQQQAAGTIWKISGPSPPLPSGIYAGTGAPTFAATVPSLYTRNDTSVIYQLSGTPGQYSSTWLLGGAAASLPILFGTNATQLTHDSNNTGALFYNPTPSTGQTRVSIQAGAGQSEDLFDIVNNSFGTRYFYVKDVGGGAGVGTQQLFQDNSQAIDVQAFGAVCDGVTDDSVAIQAAVTAACASVPVALFAARALRRRIRLVRIFEPDVTAEFTLPAGTGYFGHVLSLVQGVQLQPPPLVTIQQPAALVEQKHCFDGSPPGV